MVSLKITSIIVVAVAALSQGVLANKQSTEGFKSFMGAIIKVRGETDLWSRDAPAPGFQGDLSSCLRMLTKGKKPSINFSADSTNVDISGLTPNCMKEISAHISDPTVVKDAGTVKLTSATSIHISSLSKDFTTSLKGIEKKLGE